MFNSLKIKLPAAICMAAALLVLLFFATVAAGQEDPFSEIKGKMSVISEKERETIQKLFDYNQKIEEIEIEEKSISNNIKALKTEISSLRDTIAGEERSYLNKKGALRQVLTSYQRMGPGSYMEILLEAEDLSELFVRINILRDITRNTGTLLEEIRKSKEKQEAEKAKLSEKLVKVQNEQNQLVETLDKSVKLKMELEKYLASLADERKYYQEYLDNLQKAWDGLKPFFSNVVKEFSAFVEKGGVSEDALKMSFSFLGVKISLDDESLNKIIKDNSKFSEMIFKFRQDKVEMSVPDMNLELEGKFVIEGGYSLRFDVEKGSFYGLPLEPGVIKELFEKNPLILNFKSQLSGFKLKTLEIMEGYLKISLRPE